MKDKLINLVQINIVVMGQCNEDNNYMENYGSKDFIVCEEQDKDDIWSQWFLLSVTVVVVQAQVLLICFCFEFSVYNVF